jgi:hypothetical protein
MKKQPERVHNLLMSSKIEKGLYTYNPDGITMNFGYLKGQNLTKCYMENPEGVLDFLERILENENVPYKTWFHTLFVIGDLKNNYPTYENQI